MPLYLVLVTEEFSLPAGFSEDAFHQIIRDEGALALWNGTFPSLLLVFNPAIQFMFYEGFKRKLLKKQTQLTSSDAFVMGAVAKAVATTLTYPLQTVQSILRAFSANTCNVNTDQKVCKALSWSLQQPQISGEVLSETLGIYVKPAAFQLTCNYSESKNITDPSIPKVVYREPF